jgi:hypothetical protein
MTVREPVSTQKRQRSRRQLAMVSESDVNGLLDWRFVDECLMRLFKMPVDPLTAVFTSPRKASVCSEETVRALIEGLEKNRGQ